MPPKAAETPNLEFLFSVIVENNLATRAEIDGIISRVDTQSSSESIRNEIAKKVGNLPRIITHIEKEVPGFSELLEKDFLVMEKALPRNGSVRSVTAGVPETSGKDHAVQDKPFTFHEMERLVGETNKNLYETVAGHLLPKESAKDYVRYQLYRFIDASVSRGASDFIIQSRKDGKTGLVRMEIQFKIAGKCVTQDCTGYAKYSQVAPNKDHKFFRNCMAQFVEMANITEVKTNKQDGGLQLDYRGRSYDFRLAQLPAKSFKEATPSYCIRIITNADEYTLEKVNCERFVMKRLEEAIDKKAGGAIILTGPTGAGKSSTIYGMINRLDGEAMRIISVERPIESNSSKMQQSEEDLRPKEKDTSYTIDDALNSFMRQAGDLYMVGEMTSGHQTEATINLANRGIALITTYHVNSTVDAIVRLSLEGISRSVIGSSIRLITAQRLVPQLCQRCAIPHEKSDFIARLFEQPFVASKRYFEAKAREAIEGANINDLDDLINLLFSTHFNFVSSKEKNQIAEMIVRDSAIFLASIHEGTISETFLKSTAMYPMLEERMVFEEIRKSGCSAKRRNPEGCKECHGSGYAPRMYSIWETLELDDSIKSYIQEIDIPIKSLSDFLRDKGFLFLKDYAILSCMRGYVQYEDAMNVISG